MGKLLWNWGKNLFAVFGVISSIIGMGGIGDDVKGWASVLETIAPYINTAWVRIFSGFLFAGLFALYAPILEKWLRDKWISIQLSVMRKIPGYKKKTVRLELAKHRSKGVEFRNAAYELGLELDERVNEWLKALDEWRLTVIYSINKLDAADAEWFKTLDTVPPPRVQYPNTNNENIKKAFREHDLRLSRLDDLMQKYGTK